MGTFLKRCGESVMGLLKALDILVCSVWLGILYPFGLASKPTGRQFISTYVGTASKNGMYWARPVEFAIDSLFVLLGESRGHCRRASDQYDHLDD